MSGGGANHNRYNQRTADLQPPARGDNIEHHTPGDSLFKGVPKRPARSSPSQEPGNSMVTGNNYLFNAADGKFSGKPSISASNCSSTASSIVTTPSLAASSNSNNYQHHNQLYGYSPTSQQNQTVTNNLTSTNNNSYLTQSPKSHHSNHHHSSFHHSTPPHSPSGASCGGGSVGSGGGPDVASYWKQQLLLLQENAPRAKAVECADPERYAQRGPSFPYRLEFHGLISREETDQLLTEAGDGAYLVRESQRAPGAFTLCLRFDGATRNYKLFFIGNQHYVGEKRFECLSDLVNDGLIHMHIQKHAADYIKRMADETVYEESPYSQYQKRATTLRKRDRDRDRGRLAGMGASGESAGGATNCGNNPSARNASEGVADNMAGSGQNSLDRARELYGGSRISRSASRASNNEDQLSSEGSTTSIVAPEQTKSHQFRMHSWRGGGSWCDYCRNWMWGLTQQGMRCDDCGFAAHKRCSERALADCRPDTRYVKRMFAVDLTTLVMAHNVTIPPVVAKCVREIEERGLRAEGIYRIPGYHDEIENLRSAFDTKGDADLSTIEDINSVAGLLKLYFRLLPIPLVTYSAYRSLLDVLSHRNESERIIGITRVLAELPPAHFATLKYLVKHLTVIVDSSGDNRMSVENLARIFVPTILRNPNPINAIQLASHEQYLFQMIIRHFDTIFCRNE